MESRIIENALLGLKDALPVNFSSFSSNNRNFWKSLDSSVKQDIITRADECHFSQNDAISLSLFRDFKKTGNRKRFEDVYFNKRKKLSDLVIAECVENSGRYVSEIEEGVWSILSEPAWVLPAHNSYIRDTPQLSTPLLSRPVLDLFACETAEILALTAAVLKDSLDKILIDDIYSELQKRITIPYVTDHFWWMGSDGQINNWAPWCTQNILIAVLSNPLTSEKERMKTIKTAISTLDLFISSYGDDGGCDEGAGYYHAAALTLFGSLLVLERATGRNLSSIFQNSKIRNMASFIEDVFIADDLYLNYADCSPKAGTLTCREYLFAKACRNDAMAHHAAKDVVKYGWRESDAPYNLYYKLLALSVYNEVLKEAKEDKTFIRPRFKAFRKTDLAIWREGDITFSIKGGNNAEGHNHNDVGSIILYKGSKPLLIDIGVETYTEKTFSPERYSLKPMQSNYHNLVNFPPFSEIAGAEYMAKDVVLEESFASFDLSECYAKESGVSYIRKAYFNRSKTEIEIEELISSEKDPVLTLMSQEEPKPIENRIEYSSFTITFLSGFSSSSVEVMPIEDARLRIAWPDKLYRTLISLNGSAKWVISFK